MDSIFSQRHQNWELIVCDSYSNDGTWEYLQNFAADPRVRLFQVPKDGLYAGWNECLKRAQGEYVYIATADDTMESHCLSVLDSALEKVPDVDIAISMVSRIDEKGNMLETSQPEIWSLLNPKASKIERVPGLAFFILLCGFASGFGSITGLMMRRRLFEKTGLFPTDLWFLGDCEWALKAVLYSDVLVLADKLATWRTQGQQASSAWNLKAACLFLQSLERVLCTMQDHLPARWKAVPHWRARLLQPRQIEAELATKLIVGNMLRYPGQFPRWLAEAVRNSPRMLLRRFLSGFMLSKRCCINATVTTKKLLQDFGETWPKQRTLIPFFSGDYQGCSGLTNNTSDHIDTSSSRS